MQYDPISTLLSTVNSTAGRVIVFAGVVWLGSLIPLVFLNGMPVEGMVFGFVMNFVMACALWGSVGWLALLAIPALIIYFRRFLLGEESKQDLFVGFSVSFFLFISIPYSEDKAAVPLAIYVVLALGYWGLPTLLRLVRWKGAA